MTGRRERRRGGEGRTKAKLRRLLIKEAVPLLFDSINGRFSLGLRREFACMNETLPGIVSSVNTYRDCVYTHTYTYTARLKYDTRNHLPHHASVIIPIFNACTILFDDSLLQCNNQITFYPPFFLRRRNTLEKERKRKNAHLDCAHRRRKFCWSSGTTRPKGSPVPWSSSRDARSGTRAAATFSS